MPGPSRSTTRRLLAVLFAGSALARVGFIATITVGSLVAEDLLGSASLAGLPTAAATIGIAFGTAPIAAVMARRGRRPGIAGGMAAAGLGAAIAAMAIQLGSFVLFIAGMFLFGAGSAGDRLARYAAADIALPERRSFAISLVVWAGTVGSVLGPLLLKPSEAAALSLGLVGLAGAPLMGAMVVGAAALLALVALRPDPLSYAPEAEALHPESGPVRSMFGSIRIRFGVASLIVGQVVMVMIMTVTPVHIRRAGEDLGIVGLVIGAHTFGMFAASPLTGMLADRIGRVPVMVAGQGMLVVSAVMAAGAGGSDRGMLVASLFLLGLGWNFGFVAGSSYLTEGARPEARVALQGLADALVWSSGAAASLTSGLLLEFFGYDVLSLVGAVAVVIPVAMLLRHGSLLWRAPKTQSA